MLASKPIASIFTIVIALAACLGILAPATPAGATQADEQQFYDLTNQARGQNGQGGMQFDPLASNVARNWATQMANSQTLKHNPNLASEVDSQVTSQWTRLGENVGFGSTVPQVQNAFMNSTAHRANILGDYNRVGIGAVRDGSGTVWVAVVFVKGPPLSTPPPPAPVRVVTWLLRNNPSGGSPDANFSYGAGGDIVLSCDWDGNGTDTSGVYRNGTWFLRNGAGAGAADTVFAYGAAGYTPVCGDWDGNGTDTVGVYVNGLWLLRNSNSGGNPVAAINYGAAGFTPVVGDWDGNRTVTIGVYVNGTWLLRNDNTPGNPVAAINYGAAGYTPVVGDWDHNGSDTLGVYVNGSWLLRNSNTPGYPATSFAYGAAGYAPLVGDWSGNGDAVGVAV